jgi:competence protein ComEC
VAIGLFPTIFTWRRRAALLSAWVIVGLLPVLRTADETPVLNCHFLSVGHGCAVLVELPDGRRLLYDAGQLGLPSAAARTIAETLWFHGVTHLDAVVISHADVDHYCALPHLMERFSIGHAYISPRMFKDNDPDAVRALDRALREQGVPREIIHASDRLLVGDDVQVEVLHPGSTGVEGSDNANSVVLAITFQGRRILLTGDLEPPGLGALLNDAPLDCDVLMAPHHGSGGSDPPGLIEWCSPETVVVSGSRRDVSPAVTRAYSARGAKVFHTALDGAVTVTLSNGDVRVAAFRLEGLSSVSAR